MYHPVFNVPLFLPCHACSAINPRSSNRLIDYFGHGGHSLPGTGFVNVMIHLKRLRRLVGHQDEPFLRRHLTQLLIIRRKSQARRSKLGGPLVTETPEMDFSSISLNMIAPERDGLAPPPRSSLTSSGNLVELHARIVPERQCLAPLAVHPSLNLCHESYLERFGTGPSSPAPQASCNFRQFALGSSFGNDPFLFSAIFDVRQVFTLIQLSSSS